MLGLNNRKITFMVIFNFFSFCIFLHFLNYIFNKNFIPRFLLVSSDFPFLPVHSLKSDKERMYMKTYKNLTRNNHNGEWINEIL